MGWPQGDRVVDMDSTNDSGIKWGEPIEVTDKRRPEWLDRDIRLKWAIIEHDGSYGVWQNSWSQETQNWTGLYKGVVIRLPADHPHYQKQAAPKVDWSKPIEAVHVDGRVREVSPETVVASPGMAYGAWVDGVGRMGFDAEGKGMGRDGTGWTARNVEAVKTPKPEPTPAIDPALVERMRQMIAKMATRHKVWDNDIDISRWCSEARDILKALEPVDGDEEEAKRMYEEWMGNDQSYIDGLADAIRRGRQLEREKIA